MKGRVCAGKTAASILHSFSRQGGSWELEAGSWKLAVGSWEFGTKPEICVQAVLPQSVRHWTLTTLREKLIKIGAKVVRHSRKIIFQMAEVAVPRELCQTILERIGRQINSSSNRMRKWKESP